MSDGRASSGSSARPSDSFRRDPHLTARRAGIFCFLGPPVWPIPPQPSSSSGRQTGGHLLFPRPARLAHSAAILLLWSPDGRASSVSSARPSGPFRRNPPPPLAARRAGIFCFLGPPVWPIPPLFSSSGRQTGGHLLFPRPARLAHSAATLLLLWPPDGRASSVSSARPSGPFRCNPPPPLAARRAGIFCFLGPPVWPIPPQPSSSSGRQTGGHLLFPRPARLAHSAAIFLLWPPDGRASSVSSARPSGPFRRNPPPPLAARRAGIFCFLGPPVWPIPLQPSSSSGRQTGGHLLFPRPARLAHSAATLLLLWPPDGRASSVSSARPSGPFRRYFPPLAARRAGIFCFLGPPVWPIPPQPSSSSGRQTGGHLLFPRPARLAHSAATLLLLWPPDGRASSVSSARPSGPFRRNPPPPLAARRAGIFCFLGPPVWPIPPLSSSSGRQTGGHLLFPRPARLAHSAATLLLWPPDGRASSGSSARPSGPFRRYPPPLAARRAGIFCFLGPPVWPIPPLASSSGRQTGGHLLAPRPARLAHLISFPLRK